VAVRAKELWEHSLWGLNFKEEGQDRLKVEMMPDPRAKSGIQVIGTRAVLK
jgi:hypothetical protein